MTRVMTYRADLDLLNDALNTIRALPESDFDLLDNPFEQKRLLRKSAMHPLTSALSLVFTYLESRKSLVEQIVQKHLQYDTEHYYFGVFRYPPGGYLDVHVDAGINLETGLRKHATVILMLGQIEPDAGGDLQFWSGSSCMNDYPEIYMPVQTIKHRHGQVVLFENDDYSWHGVSEYTGERERIVITCSFMSDYVNYFGNDRNKAFFIPRPDELWTKETYDLRNKRASSETAHEVYRV